MAVTVDIQGFNRAMVFLQAKTEQTMKQVIRSESAAILEECVKRTKVAKRDVVKRKVQLTELRKLGLTQTRVKGHSTINAGWRKNAPYGRVWLRVRTGGGRGDFILARGPDFSSPSGTGTINTRTNGQWARNVASEIAAALGKFPDAIARGWENIGLARRSWVQIAESLRLNLRNLADGEAAIAYRAKYYNGAGREHEGSGRYWLDLINKLPYCRRARLDTIISRAINSRTTYFMKNLKKGVFDSLTATSLKYPGLIVR